MTPEWEGFLEVAGLGPIHMQPVKFTSQEMQGEGRTLWTCCEQGDTELAGGGFSPGLAGAKDMKGVQGG